MSDIEWWHQYENWAHWTLGVMGLGAWTAGWIAKGVPWSGGSANLLIICGALFILIHGIGIFVHRKLNRLRDNTPPKEGDKV